MAVLPTADGKLALQQNARLLKCKSEDSRAGVRLTDRLDVVCVTNETIDEQVAVEGEVEHVQCVADHDVRQCAAKPRNSTHNTT